MDRPFVYISALMRTGSTVLSEALTQLPKSFIFYETHLGKNAFSLSSLDQRYLKKYGVDVEGFLRIRRAFAFGLRRLRKFWPKQDFMIGQVKQFLVPQLSDAGFQQIGVKEVKHEGWKHFVKHFPKLRMVMLGRDPRDIYLSGFRKWQRGTVRWSGPFSPESLARALSAQFHRQLRMSAHVACLLVRYEDLCTDPRVFRRVLQFTESPVTDVGEIGRFLGAHPDRRHEHLLHGEQLSQRSVWRWKREKDQQLVSRGVRFASLMSGYSAFWGYE